MIIGKKDFDLKQHTYIMGILNLTPDSFSDGGKWDKFDDALYHVEQMIEDGMDILDVGGESTRPGYTMISEEEEIHRVIPLIEEVKKRFDVPISLDTYKGKVARAGAEAGVDLINDIWGLKFDQEVSEVVAEYKLACCLMHNRKDEYQNYMEDVKKDLRESVRIAHNHGILDQKIILDP